jgi:AhpD family alkylhydroperoxidase
MKARIAYKPLNQYHWVIKLIFFLQKKKWGQVLNPTLLWGYSVRQTLAFIGFYLAIERKRSPLPPDLRSLVMVRVAQVHGCHYCIDINSLILMERLKSKEKLLELPNWRQSPLLTQEEKWAIEYAEAMSARESEVTDEMIDRLKNFLTSEQIIELTGVIAYQNMSARFNSALNIPSQGFCELPKASKTPT